MRMHDLIKDINNYLKISGILWLYYGDDANDADDIINFTVGDDSNLFKFKQKKTSHTGDDSTKNVEIMAPLIYRNNF